MALLVILGSLIVLMLSGMHVAFAFLLISIVGMFVFFGGNVGIQLLIASIKTSISDFAFVAMVLFILMGEVMFYSGIAIKMMDATAKWLGRLPGRLSLVAVAAGTVLAALTSTSMGSIAILGALLVPEMEKRGYKKPMSIGPVLGSGGLAIMIPPSTLAVLFGVLARISIGKILLGIIIPGLVMAALRAGYILIRCRFQPSLAPSYKVSAVPLSKKLLDTVRYLLPVAFIIFMIVGLMLLGVATPNEAAATGAIGILIVVVAYRKMNWHLVKESMTATIKVAIMILMIIMAAGTFSQVLAISGAIKGAVNAVLELPLSPIAVLIGMHVVMLFMGMFTSVVPIMMITIPLFMPIITALHFDPVWFAVQYMINMEIASISPPFGLSLFVMKGVAPHDTTMGDIYRAAIPWVVIDFIAIGIIIAFPIIALWLPGLMRPVSG